VIYPLTISFTVWFVLYSKYQFEERDRRSFGKWHLWGWMMRAVFFVPFIILSFFPKINLTAGKDDVVLAAAISILLWEILINWVALKQKIFYVGSVSTTDRKLGKTKWILCFSFLAVAIVYKIVKT
jgi:hypothetical protein